MAVDKMIVEIQRQNDCKRDESRQNVCRQNIWEQNAFRQNVKMK